MLRKHHAEADQLMTQMEGHQGDMTVRDGQVNIILQVMLMSGVTMEDVPLDSIDPEIAVSGRVFLTNLVYKYLYV